MHFRKVLIAVDDDPIAAHAAEVGMHLARSLHAQVAPIHAIDPPLVFAPGDRHRGQRARSSSRAGRHAIDGGLPHPVGCPKARPPVCPAGTAGVGDRQGAQGMVVIGSHARHGITRVLGGSVAETLMRQSPCRVLLIRGKE